MSLQFECTHTALTTGYEAKVVQDVVKWADCMLTYIVSSGVLLEGSMCTDSISVLWLFEYVTLWFLLVLTFDHI